MYRFPFNPINPLSTTVTGAAGFGFDVDVLG
jgi:hypothetical protein